MKVAFDAQLLFEKQKTGIGWNAKMMLDHLLGYSDVKCILNCFYMRDKERAKAILENYRQKGCIINQCRWMPARVYNHLERIIPFPYGWCFGKQADISQFFNYVIPFGVSGKKVTIVHDMAFRAYPNTVTRRTQLILGRNLEKYCQRADIILTVSEFSKQEIHKYMGIPLEKIEVLYNGVDLERYHPAYANAQIERAKKCYQISGNYILYLGTLEPRKNIETLVKAYYRLKTGPYQQMLIKSTHGITGNMTGRMNNKSLAPLPKLVLAGKKGWMYDSIFALVQKYHLEDDVIFTGYVDEEDVPALLCGAEIFVFPTLYEGFGIPPLEAMACGTPVITSNTSSLPEVVGEAGITIPPLDTDLLAEKMAQLLSDSELKLHYISSGLKQAEKFTWKNSADKLVQIYKNLAMTV